MTKRVLAGLLVTLLIVPSGVFAQGLEKAGVVTVLEGNVKARRVALPSQLEQDLKFKDDVYLRDVVTTGDKSLARMLLGGKAVVTVRERSVLTITEIPGRPTTLELESGKFALAVARERMREGDEIQIRTPNAVAGVRGTVVITEVERQGAQTGPGAAAALTNFYVLRGAITAQLLDASRNPFGAPFQVGTMQNFSAAGLATPRVQPVLAEQIARITAGLQPTGQKGGGDAAKDQVKTQQQQQAVALMGALSGEATYRPSSSTTHAYTTAQYVLPYIPNYVDACKGASKSASTGTSNSGCEDLLDTLNSDLGFAIFSGDLTSTSPLPLFDVVNRSLSFTASFIKLLQGVTVLLAGPLVDFTNSTILTGGSVFEIQGGTLRSTSPSALISADPTTLYAAQSILLMTGGTLHLAGPLFTDTNGFVGTLNEFVKMTDNATLTSTGTGALVQLNGTSLSSTGALHMTSSTMNLSGPLATLAHGISLDPALVTAALGAPIGPDVPAFFLDNSILTSTGLGALVQIDDTDLDLARNLFALVNGSRLTLASPLLTIVDADLTTGDPISRAASMLFIGDGSLVQSTTTQPFMSFTDAKLDLSGGVLSLRRSSGTASRLSLAGPLFVANNTIVDHTSLAFGPTFGASPSACCDAFLIGQGAQLAATTAAPLIQLTNAIVNGSDAQSGGDFFSVQDTFTGAPASEVVASASVNLAGPLLSSITSSITELFTLLTVRRSTFTGTGAGALVGLTGGSITVGGVDPTNNTTTFGRLALVHGANVAGQSSQAASMTLAGPFLSLSGATVTTNFDVITALNGGVITSTSTSHFLSLDSSRITQNLPSSSQFGGAIASASGVGGPGGTTRSMIHLAGGLLSASNNSILNFPGRIVVASGGGQIVDTHPTNAFVALSGGAHTLGTLAQFPGAFGLFGRSGAGFEATETHLTLNLSIGQDQPLVRTGSGPFLQLTNGAIVNTHEAVRVDTAVLSATAPLFDVRGPGGTALTTATDAINLNQKARLTTVGPAVRIDGAVMNVVNHNLFRVASGSALVTSTDLISITNGGTLNIQNGAAILVSGTSAVNIGGSLLNFGTVSGNTVNVTNVTAPNLSCGSPCGGINVGFINGAGTSQVSIANPIKNLGSNVVNVGASSSLIIIDGTTARLTISGN